VKEALVALGWLSSLYVASCYALSLGMILVAMRELRRQRKVDRNLLAAAARGSGELPGITVLVPAYNEELGIERSVRSLLALDYPSLEVIVVNDGSIDRTLVRLVDGFSLVPCTREPRSEVPSQKVRCVFRSESDARLTVVDKRNGGKADALNAALAFASNPLVCVIDADVVIEADALVHLARPFLRDPSVVASSGTIRLVNGCGKDEAGRLVTALPPEWAVRFQVLEYCRSFTVGRLFFNVVNGHLVISGALGLFRRELLLAVGGYHPYAIGEDMELVVRMRAFLGEAGVPHRIVSVADAILFTEAPRTMAELGRQRTRWHQGLLTTLRVHRKMLFARRHGAVGLLVIPYYWAFELLSPAVEVLGWLLLPALILIGHSGWLPAALFVFAATALAVLVSTLALLVDFAAFDSYASLGDRFLLILAAVLEPFGYHQMQLFYRLRAFTRYYGGIHIRAGWVSPARASARSAR
jgi:cellulose synthase/poly-beta-1,6-N-acetylglucosamine synthase-like glycosyltransferase